MLKGNKTYFCSLSLFLYFRQFGAETFRKQKKSIESLPNAFFVSLLLQFLQLLNAVFADILALNLLHCLCAAAENAAGLVLFQ